MEPHLKTLPLLEKSSGCSCCGPTSTTHGPLTTTSNTANSEETYMTTQTYSVTGMTCGHCVHAVTSELKTLGGVSEVDVNLVAGGTSTVTVTSSQPLEDTQVAAALDEAGEYQLA